MVKITTTLAAATIVTAAAAKMGNTIYFDKRDEFPLLIKAQLHKMDEDPCNPPHASAMSVMNGCDYDLHIYRQDAYVTYMGKLKPGEAISAPIIQDWRSAIIQYRGSKHKSGYDYMGHHKIASHAFQMDLKSMMLHSHTSHIMGDNNDAPSIAAIAGAAACTKDSAWAWAAVGEDIRGHGTCMGKDNKRAASAVAMAQLFCYEKDDQKLRFEDGLLKYGNTTLDDKLAWFQ
ncbi:hypothetical protein VHEMI04495 [[Torrubiella] hemipterigena]|uniref:Uncharacterized protein n=1 Tax=[Torrubiella] hemipterigena TaxID=1531966 RepID=A0A0A1TDZ8_9HYPO|nr:hypothetical protein VHEMI04495 [[Torrubiella] hemipterigena]